MDEKNKADSIISRFTATIPLITLTILIYGVFSEYVYYYLFHFNIFSFLETSEILPQTIYRFFSLSLYILFSVYVVMAVRNVGKQINSPLLIELDKYEDKAQEFYDNLILPYELPFEFSSKEYRKNLKRNKEFPEGYRVDLVPDKTKRIVYNSLFVTEILLFIYFINFPEHRILYPKTMLTLSIGFNLSLIILLDNIIKIQFNFSKIKSQTLHVVFITLMFCIISGFIEGWTKFSNVTRLNINAGFSITIGANQILSTNKYIYIGKTKSFVFFYDVNTKLTTAYQMSQITKLTLGED